MYSLLMNWHYIATAEPEQERANDNGTSKHTRRSESLEYVLKRLSVAGLYSVMCLCCVYVYVWELGSGSG